MAEVFLALLPPENNTVEGAATPDQTAVQGDSLQQERKTMPAWVVAMAAREQLHPRRASLVAALSGEMATAGADHRYSADKQTAPFAL